MTSPNFLFCLYNFALNIPAALVECNWFKISLNYILNIKQVLATGYLLHQAWCN